MEDRGLKVELVRYTNDPILAMESAASNCYNSKPSANGKIVKQCYNSGHLSVMEFAQFHFHIEGVSRALLAQITRHRTGKFEVRSQRYCVEDGFEYVTPKTISNNNSANTIYDNIIKRIQTSYDDLISIGVPAEDARMILPNACCTVIDCSFDFRNLMHFFNERLCTRAQWEIRELAQKMRNCIIEVCPELKSYCVPKCEAHDIAFCPEHKSCGRHKQLKEMITID